MATQKTKNLSTVFLTFIKYWLNSEEYDSFPAKDLLTWVIFLLNFCQHGCFMLTKSSQGCTFDTLGESVK